MASWSGDWDARGDGAAQTAVTRLTLTDFRCYAHLRLETDGRPVVLTGPNGAGKTNLLEALSFLAPGRGLRRAKLYEVARRRAGEPETGPRRAWAVAATVRTPVGDVDLGTGRVAKDEGKPRERRIVRIDGRTVGSQDAFATHVAMQWLTPQMDRLFQEGAATRRRFLDRLVFGFDPAHAGRVAAYEHALRERSRLLRGQGKGQGKGSADPTWLAALEETMAERGVAVAAARLHMVERLRDLLARPMGPFPGAALAVAGDAEAWLADMPALAAEDRLRAQLAATRERDSALGGAGSGPHRSDLRVRHLAKDQAADQCSTGEQKALLIAIVLASARMLAEERGSAPILLLDEVAAHLDGERRAALFDTICALECQAWMTGTDAALFEPLGDRARFFAVADGAIAES